MNLSSILIVTSPQHLEATIQALNAQRGVEVHVFEEQTGRIIATLEAISVSAEMEGLKQIKSLPQILYAEMVLHYFEHDNDDPVDLSNSPAQNICPNPSAVSNIK